MTWEYMECFGGYVIIGLTLWDSMGHGSRYPNQGICGSIQYCQSPMNVPGYVMHFQEMVVLTTKLRPNWMKGYPSLN